MRISVSHNRPVDEIRKNIDRSFDDLFRGMGIAAVQIVDERRSWNANVMTFSFTAKMAFIRTPVKGTVDIRPTEVIVEADLGMLERLVSADRAREMLEGSIKGLLT